MMWLPKCLIASVLIFSTNACVNVYPEHERPCPCSEGWVCCETANICAATADLCESVGPVPDAGPDAAPAPDAKDPNGHYPDPPNPDIYANCHPLTQEGCAEGERCTYPFTVPNLNQGQLVCAADGTVPIRGNCTVDPETKLDDCVAGSFCLEGDVRVCIEICSGDALAACVTGQCVAAAGLFADDVGMCFF